MNCALPPSLVFYWWHRAWVSEKCVSYLSDTSLNGVFGVAASHYLIVFSLTCLFEAPFYFWALRGKGRVLALSALIFLNLSTHPLVALGFPQFFALDGLSKADSILFSELFAPAMEFLGLLLVLKLPARRALTGSILGNLFSWWAGGYLMTSLF